MSDREKCSIIEGFEESLNHKIFKTIKNMKVIFLFFLITEPQN